MVTYDRHGGCMSEKYCKYCAVSIRNMSTKAKFCSTLCRKKSFYLNNKEACREKLRAYAKNRRERAKLQDSGVVQNQITTASNVEQGN